MSDVTRILSQIESGDPLAAEQLETSEFTKSPGQEKNCGWSVLGSRACVRSTRITALSHAGDRRLSRLWPLRTVVI